jgi:hypothetical protein
VVRVNETLAAMQDDKQLLDTNWTSLGYYLYQFFITFIDDLGLKSIADDEVMQVLTVSSRQISEERLKLNVMSSAFLKNMLANLDRGDAIVASLSAESMTRYFKDLSPEDIMWFSQASGN